MILIKKYLLKIFIIETLSLLFVINVFSQNTVNGDTLHINDQAKFWISEELVFGTGTMPDGSYNYIYEAPNSLQKLINNHKKKLLLPGYRGYKSKVIKFEREIGHSKKDFTYSILVLETANGNRYWCDAANALNNHEILLKEPERIRTEAMPPKPGQKPMPAKQPKASSKKPVKAF